MRDEVEEPEELQGRFTARGWQSTPKAPNRKCRIRFRRLLEDSAEGFGGPAIESPDDVENLGDRRIPGALFDITDINWMDLGLFGQLFLGPAPFLTDDPDVPA